MNAKRLAIRIETEVEQLLVFQVAHDYPGNLDLTETLKDNSIILRIEQDGDTVAYVWALWRHPGWLSRALMQRLLVVAEIMGAHTIGTTPCGPTTPQIRRLLQRQGFERDGDTYQKRI